MKRRRPSWQHPSGLIALGFVLVFSGWRNGAGLPAWMMLGGLYLMLVMLWLFVLPHVNGVFIAGDDDSN